MNANELDVLNIIKSEAHELQEKHEAHERQTSGFKQEDRGLQSSKANEAHKLQTSGEAHELQKIHPFFVNQHERTEW